MMKKMSLVFILLLGPVLSLLAQGTLNISSGSQIRSMNNGYIVIKNMNLVNNGTISQTAGDGILKIKGNVNASQSGSGTTTLDQLEVAVNNGTTFSLGSLVSIRNVLSLTSGQLVSNGWLVLKSDSSYTARVATITSIASTPISGNVIAERYVKGRRKYRLMCSSVTSSTASVLTGGQENLSIWGNWQNQGNNASANSGTIITGGAAADGFDQQVQTPSMYTYDDSLRRFASFSSARGKNTKYTPLKASLPYYIFIYGDRTNTISTNSPKNTVIREAGTLLTGEQVYSSTSSIPLSTVTGRYSMMGNPYASAIDWATLGKSDLENTYWGWDPNLNSLGGFMTVNTSGAITLISPFTGSTVLNQYIQPGQGFFVRTTGATPVLTIREEDKVADYSTLVFRNSRGANELPLLAVNLFYYNGATRELADGALAAFDSSYSVQTGKEDAVKMDNAGESVSMLNGMDHLSIDARKKPVSEDTLFLEMERLTKAQYSLQIFAHQMEFDSLQPYLQDLYLNTLQPISTRDTSYISFGINQAIPASYAVNRFRIIFKKGVFTPQPLINVQAVQKNNTIQVNWQLSTESAVVRYEILKSANDSVFSKVGEVSPSALNGNPTYSWLDNSPLAGINYYRVKAIMPGGSQLFSKTVAVDMKSVLSAFHLYPNPVKNGQLHIRAVVMDKGLYSMELVNTMGQIVLRTSFSHTGGAFDQVLLIPDNRAAGICYLNVIHNKMKCSYTVYIE